MGIWPFDRKSEQEPVSAPEPHSTGVRGWWFARTYVDRGRIERFDGTPVPGREGLHAAPGPFDALPHARSAHLCEVELAGTIIEVEGQMAATQRRVIWCIDISELLDDLARAWIERVLGAPVESRAAHIEAAGAAREFVIEADDRVRDARWVLDEGAGRKSGRARAEAEGKLAGAERAASEARASAEMHEAAAALLEGNEIRHVARAVEHATRAHAAFERGGADEALGKAREKLEREMLLALAERAPSLPLPPVRVSEPGPEPEHETEADKFEPQRAAEDRGELPLCGPLRPSAVNSPAQVLAEPEPEPTLAWEEEHKARPLWMHGHRPMETGLDLLLQLERGLNRIDPRWASVHRLETHHGLAGLFQGRHVFVLTVPTSRWHPRPRSVSDWVGLLHTYPPVGPHYAASLDSQRYARQAPFLVVPAEDPAEAIRTGQFGIVPMESVKELYTGDANLRAAMLLALAYPSLLPVMEPLSGEVLRLCAHVMCLRNLVSAAGVAFPDDDLGRSLVVWVRSHERADIVDERLEDDFPTVPRILVVGGSRPSPTLDEHELLLSEAAKSMIEDRSKVALAPTLLAALAPE